MHPLIDHAKQRIRADYPRAVAIILKGSHALGTATPYSDVDFDVLLPTPDVEDYRTWLEPYNGRLVHISAAVESADAWIADSAEHSIWSLGLPTIETTKLLWAADDDLRAKLHHPYRSHPAMDPEVEDSVEALLKVRKSLAKGDDYGVYRNAAKLATLAPTMLVPINPHVAVPNSRSAIDAVLAFPNAPAGFAEDWLTCIGYVDARTPDSTRDAAERIVRGILPLLPADPDVVGEDIARILADGSLLAYISQDDA